MTTPVEHTRPDRLTITDPAAVRSLTNPARFLAVDQIYSTQRPHTATELAEIAGVSPSAMSYHLRELASFGIVERAPAGDGREHPWAPVAADYTIGASDDLEVGDHLRLLDAHLVPMRQRMQTVLARRSLRAQEERDGRYMVLATGRVLLTREEIAALRGEVDAVWRRYEEISRAREQGLTDGYERALYMWSILPETPGDDD